MNLNRRITKRGAWCGQWSAWRSLMLLCLWVLLPTGQTAIAQTDAAADTHKVMQLDVNRVEIDLSSPWFDTERAAEEHTESAMVDRSGEYPKFKVIKTDEGVSHVWYSGWFGHPVDIIKSYPILVVTYRTTGYDVKSKHYTLTINDGCDSS